MSQARGPRVTRKYARCPAFSRLVHLVGDTRLRYRAWRRPKKRNGRGTLRARLPNVCAQRIERIAAGGRSPLSIRSENVVLVFHEYMARVAAAGARPVRLESLGRGVVVELGVSPVAGSRK